MGILDAATAHVSRTTGMLEDFKINVELQISRAFEAFRCVVGAVCWVEKAK